MNIGELADAAGITRRAVRFYVQQRLLPPPLGVGRGDHYDHTHLAALRRINELQRTGHSLAAIARILAGDAVPQPPRAPQAEPPPEAPLAASAYTRFTLAPGVELHIDTARHPLAFRDLPKIQRALREIFEPRDTDSDSNP